MPERATELATPATPLFDLLPVVRDNYYHSDFGGSFSIESVLPVLAPESGYDDLEIAEGTMASVQYTLALANEDFEERERTFADLQAYCERDTYAMVRLREALAQRAAG